MMEREESGNRSGLASLHAATLDEAADALPSSEAEEGGIASSARDTDEKQAFLLETIRRTTILGVLRDTESATASELTAATNRSRSTIHRAIDSLLDHDLITKEEGEYRLTTLGAILAEETNRFSTRAWSAATLEPFLNAIDETDIPVEYFEDAVITRRQPREPHIAIQRLIELVEETSELRMLSTVLSPIHVEFGYRAIMDGTVIKAVFDAELIDIMLEKYQEKAQRSIETGNFHVYMHDGLPFELFIFDDKMGMAAHDETGSAEVLVECSDPAAIEWAEDVYATHLADADALVLPTTEE